jgi:IS605 OrfB family transposase
MRVYTTYKVKIKHYNHIFKDTIAVYRAVVDYLINVCVKEWDNLSLIDSSLNKQRYVEILIHATKGNPNPVYDFDSKFYKTPSYLRRGAINEAVGKVSSYMSNLSNWNKNHVGRKPSVPKAGYVFPSMYRTVMYNQISDYKAQIKVYIRDTWDWITIDLRKSDMDYIYRHCKNRSNTSLRSLYVTKQCAPTLQKRGKEWFLDFPFEENVTLCDIDVYDQTVVAVDLGINTAATISVMHNSGTILGRYFCKLPKETDHLAHSINRIKKAQQNGNHKTPRLWAKVKGINHDIASKTANYIIDLAVLYNADVIVFEHLDKNHKVRGSKKQKIKMWRSQEVQSIVTNKAHRFGMRVSHVCAWFTSKLAYDGSGTVVRGAKAGFNTYELCKFQNGKIYNCDLSASYNIGARYFIREILKSLDVSSRLGVEAKVPQCTKRSTCTFSTLISLNAVLMSLMA